MLACSTRVELEAAHAPEVKEARKLEHLGEEVENSEVASGRIASIASRELFIMHPLSPSVAITTATG